MRGGLSRSGRFIDNVIELPRHRQDIPLTQKAVPAVYGITSDPYLGYGLATILAFIGVKLVLHWAHGIWAGVPEIPTLASLGVIIGVLVVVTATSLYARRGSGNAEAPERAAVSETESR